MLKKVIKYTDYDGNEREEEYYFNLKRHEIVEMQVSESDGFDNLLVKIANEKDYKKLVAFLEMIILKSYGEKTPDGKRFIKSPELSSAFSQTEAYDTLFMELAMDADSAAAFIRGIMPSDFNLSDEEVAKIAKEKGLNLPDNKQNTKAKK